MHESYVILLSVGDMTSAVSTMSTPFDASAAGYAYWSSENASEQVAVTLQTRVRSGEVIVYTGTIAKVTTGVARL